MRSILKRDATAVAIFFALTLGLTNPLVLHIANAVEDKQDGLLNVWIIAWVGHSLITDPLNLFNANIFYPYANTLAFSETMLPQGILALPFNLAFDNTILAYNLILLFSFFLAAYAMYLFVFDLTRSRPGAIIAGTIFSFNPYNLGNLAQIQLLSFGWMPLVLLYLKPVLLGKIEKVHAKNARPRLLFADIDLRKCFLLALFFSLQCLSSFYYAFLAAIAVSLNLLIFLLVRHTPSIAFYKSLLKRLTISAAICALLVAPFFVPYYQVQRDLGFERQVGESEPFSASLKLFSEVAPQNFLYRNLLAPRKLVYNGGYPLDNLFPGFVALALAIIGLLSRNRERWFYFALFAVSFVLSLGPRLYIAPTQPTDLTLPYGWLYDIFPLMRALRAPVRFDALVMFALAVLAGIGVSSSVSLKVRPGMLSALFACGLALCALEYLALPAANITPVPVWNDIPEYVRWLAQLPRGVALELPMIASDPDKPLDLTTQYLSTYHWQATPDGYSGFNPPRRGETAYEMQFLPNDRAVSLLQALDVQYVVIHTAQFSDGSTLRGALDKSAAVQLATKFGNDYIYRVAARSTDPSALDVRLYLPEPAAPSQPYTAYLIALNPSPTSFAVKPTDSFRVEALWSHQIVQHVAAALPLVTTDVSIVPITTSAPTHEGDYRLDLRVSGLGRQWNLSGQIAVRAQEPSHQVVIPAQIVLSSPLKTEYTRGDSIPVKLTWLPKNKVNAYYSASVRVVNAQGEKIVAQDRQPSIATLMWIPGTRVEDLFTLTLPRDMAAGEYTMRLLMYQAEQKTEVLLLDEKFAPEEEIILGKFVVK